jgi:hypothetical protein
MLLEFGGVDLFDTAHLFRGQRRQLAPERPP